jgi:hypothetical protein
MSASCARQRALHVGGCVIGLLHVLQVGLELSAVLMYNGHACSQRPGEAPGWDLDRVTRDSRC